MNPDTQEALRLHAEATAQQLRIALAEVEKWKARYLEELARTSLARQRAEQGDG